MEGEGETGGFIGGRGEGERGDGREGSGKERKERSGDVIREEWYRICA